MLVGGGTGGHIKPLLAVAHELKKQGKNTRTVLVAEKGTKFDALAKSSTDIDVQERVRAGKFRRYHNERWYKKLLDIKTFGQNVTDFFRTIAGFFDALGVIRRTQPDVAFIKGGFVGVPMGLACAIRRVPYITHDSDTHPGLANRIIGRWARIHAVGMPEEFYAYPKAKMKFVGVPLGKEYHRVNEHDMLVYRERLDLPKSGQVITITGGSLGAQRLNIGMELVVGILVKEHPGLHILHQTGASAKQLYSSLDPELRKRIRTVDFVDDLACFTGAADLVVARAGATTISELAVQHKPVILVPNAELTGGHQLKNAKHLKRQGAVEILDETTLRHPTEAVEMIDSLLRNPRRRKELSQAIGKLSSDNAAASIATMIVSLLQEREA